VKCVCLWRSRDRVGGSPLASLEKLANMVNVLGGVRIIDGNIIYDVAVPAESRKGIVHPTIVVF